jgi:hypothetical protein
MKNTIKLTVFACLFWLAVFAGVALSQTDQNESRWALYAGFWDNVNCYNDSTTQDTLFFEQGDTLYTEAFRCWPYMSASVEIVDTTSATDSVKTLVKFLQSESITKLAKEYFSQVRDLTWRSTSSLSEADTLTAVGNYQANITDEPIYAERWGRFMIIAPADSKKLPGNYMLLKRLGWAAK